MTEHWIGDHQSFLNKFTDEELEKILGMFLYKVNLILYLSYRHHQFIQKIQIIILQIQDIRGS